MQRTFFLLVTLVTCLSACDNSYGDMYDPEWVREQYENQWKIHFGEIDPNQNFNMAKPVKTNLSIKEDALSEYTFKIYTANPLYDDNAFLMAKKIVMTDANGFAETSISFDALLGQETFYVVRTNSHGRRLVKALKAVDGTVEAYFGNSITNIRSRGAEMGTFPAMDAPYSEAEVNQMIADGYDLSQGLDFFNQWGGSDKVKDFYSIALAANNASGSTISVITTAMDALSTYNTSYTTKGNRVVFDWDHAIEAYEPVLTPITVAGTVKVVIATGGVLNFNNSGIVNLDIIVASGGTLVLNNTFDMGTNARLIVMPGGKVVDNTTSGNSLKNNDGSSLVYIAGDMIDIRSYLQNSGTTYVAPHGMLTGEEISMQNYNCVLTNYGKVDVDRIVGNGNQGTLNNACLLRSDEKIQVAYLNQATNTAVECNEIYVNHVTLRDNSLLRSKHLDMNGSASFIDYVGTSGSSALVSALWFGVNNANTKITGAVYVEAGEYESPDDRLSIETVAPLGLSTVGEADFAIFPVYTGDNLKESDCTGEGNIPTDYVPDLGDEAQTWRVACEDLGSVGDYDFNDIVFDVSFVAGEGSATVTAQAAGGTLAAYLCHETAGEIGEIHNLFDLDDVTLMINTGVGIEWGGRNNFVGKTLTISVPEGFSMSDNMGGFYLTIVNGDKEIRTTVGPKAAGETPQMICVPSDWRWPTETINIGVAYPNFGVWGSNYGNGSWYMTVVTDYVY